MRAVTDAVIREFRADDTSAMAAIHSAVFPDAPLSTEEMHEEITRFDHARFVARWLVAARPDGKVVGYGAYRHTPYSFHPEKFRVWIVVHPRWQRCGIGTRLMDALLAGLHDAGARRLIAWTREDVPQALAFVARYGFAEYAGDVESRLDVAGADPTAFRATVDRVEALGVVITTLADELARDPACLGAVYQAHCTFDLDSPRDDPDLPTPPSVEMFIREEVRHPQALADAFFLARWGDLYVGESALKRSAADPRLLHQQLTGVLGAYRGLGIATALKVRTIEYAQRHGYGTICTFNSSRNPAMLAVNLKLGFVPRPAWISLLKTLP